MRLLSATIGSTIAGRTNNGEPAGVAFEVMECKPLPSSPNPQPQADNGGRRKLAIHLRNVESARIQVSMAP
jgi:hypothetical protein